MALLLLAALAVFAQGDPFSAVGNAGLTIANGSFGRGLVEIAIMVAGILIAFSGRVIAGVLIAVIGGGSLVLSAAAWMGWIQSIF